MAEVDLIRKLSAFCKLSKREHYSADHDELAAYLELEAQLFSNDLAMCEAVGRLSHELQQWSEAVEDIRERWLWDNCAMDLPEDFIAVFGCDNELSRELQRIVAAMQRLISHLRRRRRAITAADPFADYTQPLTKDEVRRLYGRSETWLRKNIKPGGQVPCTDVQLKTLRLLKAEYAKLLQKK